MNEEVTLAQLRLMRQMAITQGNTKDQKRLTLAISMRTGIYPPLRTHKNRNNYDNDNNQE